MRPSVVASTAIPRPQVEACRVMLPERVQLPAGHLVALEGVRFGKEGAHVTHKAAYYSGRKF
jgi:hypothetical protein